MRRMPFVYHDGGRKEAGYRGKSGDCVCRAIAIATGRPYQEIYDALNAFAQENDAELLKGPRYRGQSSDARTGVFKPTRRAFIESLGWVWTPTMSFGSGCTVHLRQGELPPGRLMVAVSRHMCAVIDGVIYDTHDPGRDGTRCVYGLYRRPEEMALYPWQGLEKK